MSNWTPKDIVRWHKQALPNTTAIQQLKKLAEETNEYHAAPDPVNRMEEMADVIIAATVLWHRYGEPLGYYMSKWRPEGISEEDAQAAVDCKMDINAERKKWKHNHHVG